MLMVAILSWKKDLIFQSVSSAQSVKELKIRLNLPDTDYIIHDSNFLCPLKMDRATRQLTEDEIIEWLHTEVYPALLEEGRMVLKNGSYRYIREK